MPLPRPSLARLAAATAALAALLTGCAQPEPPPPQPAEVRVVSVEARPLTHVVEVPGRLQAVRSADVRARVDGIVERRVYTEGSDVRAGQALFAIDPRPLRAQLGAAEAALARAEATAANARQDVARYEGLVGRQALSQQEYDAGVARLRTAEADVAAARAGLATARLNLGFATVEAPIAGRVGRAAVTEGALVSAGAGTLLTRIEQLDPLFVNFSQAGGELVAIRQALARGGRNGSVAVRLVLEDGSVYDRTGRLDFLDLSIDEATGTAALRAEIPNPDRLLLPGQFVRVRLDVGEPTEGLMVPQRAVTLGAQGGSVMILDRENRAERREVTLGGLRGDAWVVLSGLAAGDRVITDGLQKVQAGQPVRVAADAAAADSAALSAAPADSTDRASL